MSHWTLYWITRLDQIQMLFGVGIAASIIACFIFGNMVILADDENDNEKVKSMAKRFYKSLSAMFLCCFIIALVPNTKDMALIYVAPKIINSEFTEEVATEAKEITSMALDRLKKMIINEPKTSNGE